MLGTQLTPAQYLRRCSEVFETLDLAQVQGLADDIYAAYQDGRFVFLCGNGGSGSNCSHFCEDLGKSTLDRKDFTNDAMKRLKVLSLTDNTPYILAWGNDEGFDRVFVEQLKNFASPNDVLIAISGSGNSRSVLNAVQAARDAGALTIGFCGYDGGRLRDMVDISVHVPCDIMAMVEDIHLMLEHAICERLLALNKSAAAEPAH